MHGLNNHLVKEKKKRKQPPACPLCQPCLPLRSYLGGARNQFGLRQAGPGDSQVGEVARRQELNRAEQPAIHMDQVDRLSINGLPLESKTPAQAREELLREIRIAAAIRVSLYVSRCLLQLHFPSPGPPSLHPRSVPPRHLPTQRRQPERQKAFSEVIHPLVLCIEWRGLLTAFWNTIGFLSAGTCAGRKYGMGEGTY